MWRTRGQGGCQGVLRLLGHGEAFLGLGEGNSELQTGENKDIRYVMCELGFTNAFFRMMLDVIRTDEQKAVVENDAGDSAQANIEALT